MSVSIVTSKLLRRIGIMRDRKQFHLHVRDWLYVHGNTKRSCPIHGKEFPCIVVKRIHWKFGTVSEIER
jgi:hypothetical protein